MSFNNQYNVGYRQNGNFQNYNEPANQSRNTQGYQSNYNTQYLPRKSGIEPVIHVRTANPLRTQVLNQIPPRRTQIIEEIPPRRSIIRSVPYKKPNYNFYTPVNKPAVPLMNAPKFNYGDKHNPYRVGINRPQKETVKIIQQAPGNVIKTVKVVNKKIIAPKKESMKSPMNIDFPLCTRERQYVDINLRYPNLYISSDFIKMNAHWLSLKEFPINVEEESKKRGTCELQCDNVFGVFSSKKKEKKKKLATLDLDHTKHNAKVMMGAYDGRIPELRSGGSGHFFKHYKFLVGKKGKEGLLIPGGSWVKSEDGDNPYDDAVLRATAVRTVKNFCGIDLSKLKEKFWYKIIDVSYHRPAEIIRGETFPEMYERSVIFMINVCDILPTTAEYSKVVKGKKFSSKMGDKEVPSNLKYIPKSPTVYSCVSFEWMKNNYKTMMISIDGLLDYNREEGEGWKVK